MFTADLVVGFAFGAFFGFFGGIAFTFWGVIWLAKGLGRLADRLKSWRDGLEGVKEDIERAQEAAKHPPARRQIR